MIGKCLHWTAITALFSTTLALDTPKEPVLSSATSLRTDERAVSLKKYWDEFGEMPPAEMINQYAGFHADVFNTINLAVYEQLDECFESNNISRNNVVIKLQNPGFYHFYLVDEIPFSAPSKMSEFSDCVETYGVIDHISGGRWTGAITTSTDNMTRTLSQMNDNETVALLWSREAFMELFHGELQVQWVGEVPEIEREWDNETDWESQDEAQVEEQEVQGEAMEDQEVGELVNTRHEERQQLMATIEVLRPSIGHAANDTTYIAPRPTLATLRHIAPVPSIYQRS